MCRQQPRTRITFLVLGSLFALAAGCDVLPFGVSKIPEGIYEGTVMLTVNATGFGENIDQNTSLVVAGELVSIAPNGLPQDIVTGQEYRSGTVIRRSLNFGGQLGEPALSIAVESVIQSQSRVVVSGTVSMTILGVDASGPYRAVYEFIPPDSLEENQTVTLVFEGMGFLTFELEGTLQR